MSRIVVSAFLCGVGLAAYCGSGFATMLAAYCAGGTIGAVAAALANALILTGDGPRHPPSPTADAAASRPARPPHPRPGRRP